MRRSDVLAGCIEDSEEEAELEKIIGPIEACEANRWPQHLAPPRGRGAGAFLTPLL